MGGGAIFFSLERKKRAYLSDANEQLVNVYIQVRDNPDMLITILQDLPNTKDDYYRIREEITEAKTIENASYGRHRTILFHQQIRQNCVNGISFILVMLSLVTTMN